MQKILWALLYTLLFTGCLERGYTLKPAPVHKAPIERKQKQAVPKAKPITVVKSKSIPIPPSRVKINTIKIDKMIKTTSVQIPHTPTTNVDTESIFSLSEETKRNISGFFILVIGIIILL